MGECKNCRYRNKQPNQYPCSIGVYQMRYSHNCLMWKKPLLFQRIITKHESEEIKMRCVKVKENSNLYKYFKNITLVVANDKGCWSGIPIYGCITADEEKFYKGILAMDKKNNVKGFESVEDVEDYWLRGGDGSMFTIPDDELIEIKPVKKDGEKSE